MKDAVMSMKKGKNPLLFLMVVLVLGIVFMPVDLSAESEKQDIPSEPDEIPFPYELVETLSAEEVNLWWAEQGYDQPPYQPGTSVMVLCLTEDTVFARVYDCEVSGMYGGWIMDYHALDGLTPEMIRDLYALPAVPRNRVDVILPAGSLVRRGICNAVPEWGEGGGIQYDMMGERIGEFVNEKPLEEEEAQDDSAA